MNRKPKSSQDKSFQKSSHCKCSMASSSTISWNHTHIGWNCLLLSHTITWP